MVFIEGVSRGEEHRTTMLRQPAYLPLKRYQTLRIGIGTAITALPFHTTKYTFRVLKKSM